MENDDCNIITLQYMKWGIKSVQSKILGEKCFRDTSNNLLFKSHDFLDFEMFAVFVYFQSFVITVISFFFGNLFCVYNFVNANFCKNGPHYCVDSKTQPNLDLLLWGRTLDWSVPQSLSIEVKNSQSPEVRRGADKAPRKSLEGKSQ